MRENRIILALVLGDDKVSSQSASLLVEVTLRTLAGDQQLAGALLWLLRGLTDPAAVARRCFPASAPDPSGLDTASRRADLQQLLSLG
jgi:hypothetical protein